MLAEQRQDPPLDPLVEEVRVAMALNGGISLAVWMDGCAVELDCARRGHTGHERVGVSPFDAFSTTSAALALVAAPLLGLGYIAASGRLRGHDAA